MKKKTKQPAKRSYTGSTKGFAAGLAPRSEQPAPRKRGGEPASAPAESGRRHERVLILDFGSQYTQLIARRVRECGVYSEIVPHTISPADLAAGRPAAIILSGGPASVTEAGSPTCDAGLLRLGIPVLGICYGLQLMAKMLGGRVLAAERREYGHAVLQVLKRQDLFVGLGPRLQVWMSHGEIGRAHV